MSGFRGSANDISDYMLGSLDYDYNDADDIDRNDRHSGYGGHGSHSGSGYGGGKEACCPLVVDTLCLAAILGAVAGAAALLNQVIMLEIMPPGRRRKRRATLAKTIDSGELRQCNRPIWRFVRSHVVRLMPG